MASRKRAMSSSPEQASEFSAGRSSGGWLLPAAAAVAMLLLLASFFFRSGGDKSPDGRQHSAVGKSLSHLELTPLSGADEPVRLDDLRGQVALINYWGPWCYYCLAEMPHLVELHQELADEDDFRLLSVSCAAGPRADLDALRTESQQTLDEFGADWPIYADPNQSNRRALVETADMSQGFGFPTTVLLDRQGNIAGVWLGYMKGMEANMEQAIREQLAKP